MPLDFVKTEKPLEAVKIRFKPDAYNVVVDYGRTNDIESFNAALQTMLLRIKRIGVKRFYELTAEGAHAVHSQVNENSGKIINIGTNHGSVSDESPAQSP